MHNLSRIYDWQYCHVVGGVEEDAEAEDEDEKGGAEAWRLARRLCVQEIKLPNAHYLSKG